MYNSVYSGKPKRQARQAHGHSESSWDFVQPFYPQKKRFCVRKSDTVLSKDVTDAIIRLVERLTDELEISY
mgnify:CR=1 FL=1